MQQPSTGTKAMQLVDILYDKQDGVAIATFDRPKRLNAYRLTTLRELQAILEDARTDDSIRVLVITGAGRAFCAGEDLKELGLGLEQLTRTLNASPSFKQMRDQLPLLQEITRQMVTHPKPIIAAVNGFAVGGGAELAVCSDSRIASEKASFAFVEVKRALLPTNGVHYLLPRLIGEGRAMDLLLTGRTMSAQEALDAGLVTVVVPDGELMQAALDMASVISTNAPISVELIKRTMRRVSERDLEAAMQLEVEAFAECAATEDSAEGVRSFLEKRAAAYKGK